MNKSLVIGITVFAVATGLLVWWFSDAQVIKRRTNELTEVFSIKSGSGKASRVLMNRDLGELVDGKFSCIIDLDNYSGEHNKDELLEAHLYFGQACESSAVVASDVEILSITDDRAEVTANFSISVRHSNGNSYSESAPATLIWVKSSDESWKLVEIVLEAQ